MLPPLNAAGPDDRDGVPLRDGLDPCDKDAVGDGDGVPVPVDVCVGVCDRDADGICLVTSTGTCEIPRSATPPAAMYTVETISVAVSSAYTLGPPTAYKTVWPRSPTAAAMPVTTYVGVNK